MSGYVISERAARALTRVLRGASPSSAPTYSRASISPDAFPPPFTVRWSASANEGSGAWVIWLPDADSLLWYADAYVQIGGITAAAELPDGWYTIDETSPNSSAIYLNVTIDESSSQPIPPTAELSDTAGQSATGSTCIPILIATFETDQETNAKRVKQFVDSAITLSADGKAGEDGADAGIRVTATPIAPSTDHPGGGTHLSFQPLKNGQPDGQPTEIDIYNGHGGGGGGGPDLSDSNPQDTVLFSGQASPGTAATASRSDHVHKMPNTVVDTVTENQVINANKLIALGKMLQFLADAASSPEGVRIDYYGSSFRIRYREATGSGVRNILNADSSSGILSLGDGTLFVIARLGANPATDVSDASASNAAGRNIPTIWWTISHLVTLTTDQTINAIKTIAPKSGQTTATLKIENASGNAFSFSASAYQGNDVLQVVSPVGGNSGNIVTVQGSFVELGGRSSVSDAVNDVRLGNGANAWLLANVTPANAGKNIASTKWVDNNYQRKLSQTVTFIEDVQWDATNHKLVKVWGSVDLSTGTVTHDVATPTGMTKDIATTAISDIVHPTS